MALVEEDLPGVRKVRQEFQMREDSILAQQLQEREFEEHFDANVQLRRTAMQDVRIAKQLQNQETSVFKEEEQRRRAVIAAQEEKDREDARRLQEQLEQEAEQQNARDAELASKLHKTEASKAAQQRLQEEADMRLARQHSFQEQQQQQKLEELSLREVRRLQQLDLSDGPPVSDPLPPPVSSIISGAPEELPSYDSLMFDGDDPEEQMDENERQALQEQRDIELARQLQEKEAKKIAKMKRRQELADEELARRMQEEEESARRTNRQHEGNDMEVARQLQADTVKQMTDQEKRDMELAQKIELERRELARKQSEQELADLEIAKKLQKEEIIARKREMRLRKERQELEQLRKAPQDLSSPTHSLPPGAQAGAQANTSPVKSVTASLPADVTANGGARVLSSLPSSRKPTTDTPDGADSPAARQSYRRQQQSASKKKSKSKK